MTQLEALRLLKEVWRNPGRMLTEDELNNILRDSNNSETILETTIRVAGVFEAWLNEGRNVSIEQLANRQLLQLQVQQLPRYAPQVVVQAMAREFLTDEHDKELFDRYDYSHNWTTWKDGVHVMPNYVPFALKEHSADIYAFADKYRHTVYNHLNANIRRNLDVFKELYGQPATRLALPDDLITLLKLISCTDYFFEVRLVMGGSIFQHGALLSAPEFGRSLEFPKRSE